MREWLSAPDTSLLDHWCITKGYGARTARWRGAQGTPGKAAEAPCPLRASLPPSTPRGRQSGSLNPVLWVLGGLHHLGMRAYVPGYWQLNSTSTPYPPGGLGGTEPWWVPLATAARLTGGPNVTWEVLSFWSSARNGQRPNLYFFVQTTVPQGCAKHGARAGRGDTGRLRPSLPVGHALLTDFALLPLLGSLLRSLAWL